MKKLLLCFLLATSLQAMVRAGVDVGPQPVDDGVYYDTWYGPGWYYGVYFNDYPTYYAWRQRYYYGGPYYWRHNHNYHRYERHHHHHDDHHHHN